MSRAIDRTDRGFGVYCRFRDRYGSEILVQQSSLAFEDCVWIFAGDNPDMDEPSPHLTRTQAIMVRDALTAWIEDFEPQEMEPPA